MFKVNLFVVLFFAFCLAAVQTKAEVVPQVANFGDFVYELVDLVPE